MKNIRLRALGALCALALILCTCLSPSAAGDELSGGADIYSNVENSDSVAVSRGANDVRVASRLWELLFGKKEDGTEDSESDGGCDTVMLIPGGTVFGARIKQTHLTVTEADEALGLMDGDILISIDGKKISDAQGIRAALEDCGGKEVRIVFERNGERIERTVTPQKVGGEWRLGILFRDGAAGIGTVTFIDPETKAFGGLGHGICESDGKEPIEMRWGAVTGVILGGVQKGEAGKPGELCGILTDKQQGEVYSNTNCGVFGKLDSIPQTLSDPLPTAHRNEVHEGKATIISTVKNGVARKYDVEISSVDRTSTGTKCFKVKVTDPALIALTGGIVRGMSGSPIIQDGKLVGAVTHVMVANPTEGYGIFIENMLNAAESQVQPKAA